MAEYHKTYKGKHLHAGRMEPFFEAFADEYPGAKTPRDKMFLIDVLIHRCHGDYAGSPDRPGGINLIGGKPREVREFLDELGGVRRADPRRDADTQKWVQKVRREREPGWR